MKIGIIGVGIVGSACRRGFELLGHNVVIHDPKFNTSIKNVIDTEIVYVCVPTPEQIDGSCDLSILQETINDLEKLNYQGVVALKSTSVPGTTENFIRNTKMRLCFVPEFLRERKAAEDFTVNHTLLAVGCHTSDIFDIVVASHGFFPKKTAMMSPTEAEMLKYYSNVFNSTRVIFANVMYEICQMVGADYDKVKDTYLLRGTASPDYLDCGDSLRGFGGMCLPKDTKALAALGKSLGIDLQLLETVIADNSKIKKTVFPGMRP
jgi:UDPglucose 6-dehydrogenase